MNRTIVAVFDTFEQAARARQDLLDSGFSTGETDISQQAEETVARERVEGEGFWAGLRNFFLGEDVDYYEEAARRGNAVLSITSDEDRIDRAIDIIQRHDPIDIDRRAEEWRQTGWTGRTREATTGTRAQAGGEETIPVVEEKLRVGKQREARGGVRIYSRIVETPVEQDVTLREEKVDVERRKADRPARAGDLREQTVEMSEFREEPVVSKEAVVIEEIVLRKDVKERKKTVKDTVKRTEVEVEQLDKQFRGDYQERFGTSGYTYDQYRPAYRYGYDLAQDPRFSNKSWSEVEPEARRMFEDRNPGMWEQFKDAVRSAFERRERKAA